MEDFEQARERVVEVLQPFGVALPDDTDARLVYTALCGQLWLHTDERVTSELSAFDEACRAAASLADELDRIHDARAFVTRSLGYVVRSSVPIDQPIGLGQVRERLRQVEAGNDRIRRVGQTAIRVLRRIFDADLAPAIQPPDIIGGDG